MSNLGELISFRESVLLVSNSLVVISSLGELISFRESVLLVGNSLAVISNKESLFVSENQYFNQSGSFGSENQSF